MRAVSLAIVVSLVNCCAVVPADLSDQEREAFRVDATEHIWREAAWCPLTLEPVLVSLYEPVKARSRTFRADIRGTPLQAEYERAYQTWDEEFGDLLVECADPLGLEDRARVADDVAEYEALMTRLEGWVNLVEQRLEG